VAALLVYAVAVAQAAVGSNAPRAVTAAVEVVEADSEVLTGVASTSRGALWRIRPKVARGNQRCWTCPTYLANALGMDGRSSRLEPHVAQD
jgi:hypothetical protein